MLPLSVTDIDAEQLELDTEHSSAARRAREGSAARPDPGLPLQALAAPMPEEAGLPGLALRVAARLAWLRRDPVLRRLLGVVATVYLGARLLQIAAPEQLPRVLEVWGLDPLVRGIPLDFAPQRAGWALVPWGLQALLILLLLQGLPALRAGAALAHRQVLALTLLPLYNLWPGAPRLASLFAQADPARAAWLRALAWAVVTLRVAVAALLALLALHPLPWGALLLQAVDGLLLLAQLGALHATFRTLWPASGLRPHPASPAAEPAPEPLPCAGADVDAALACPECTPRTPLLAAAERLDSTCPGCGASFLGLPARRKLLAELGIAEGALARLTDEGGRRTVACVSCFEPLRGVLLRGVVVHPCQGCHTLWLRAGALHRLTDGHHGQPAAPAPGLPTAASRTLQVLSPRASVLALGLLVLAALTVRPWLEEGLACPRDTAEVRTVLPDGFVRRECRVPTDGRRHGLSRLRDAQGRLREERDHAAPGVAGRYRLWDAAGQLRSEGTYVDARRSGEWLLHAEEGHLASRLPYVQDKAHGEELRLAPGGAVVERLTHAHGRLHGRYRLYFPSGAPRLEGEYVDGRRHGKWQRYDAAGVRGREEYWFRGELGSSHGRGWDERLYAEAEQREEQERERQLRAAATRAPAGLQVPAADRLYGGHTREWWERRLGRLMPTTGSPSTAGLYALTLQRARLNGLHVVEGGVTGPRVLQQPPASDATAQETP